MSDVLEQITVDEIMIPSMVAAELFYGAEKSRMRQKSMGALKAFLSVYEMVPFCAKAVEIYAFHRAELERKGCMIGSNDLIIAATVLAHSGTLVTNKIGEYSRIDDLNVVNWV
jgi:tRNA(fMet)-specific endonuclease VapC